MHFSEYKNCKLCARECGIDREIALGACRSPSEVRLARAALHFWEEPIISGDRGSGTIFFSGCSLACSFCQNREISRAASGKTVSVERLADIMLDLERSGAHNVNLVTPTHYIPSIKEAIFRAKDKGLSVPIVYNTGSYDKPESLRSLEGLVDIYLADYKFYTKKTAKKYANAEDYPAVAEAAIDEMLRQRGAFEIEDGIMKSGVIIRLLQLPSGVAEAKLSLSLLYKKYSDAVYFSLMNQFTPMPGAKPPLNRRVTVAEYEEFVSYADRLGVKNAFIQEFGCAEESFIPPFDYTGV